MRSSWRSVRALFLVNALVVSAASLPSWGAPPAVTSKSRVSLALCPDVDTCAEELGWLRAQDEIAGESLLVADTLLELDTRGWQEGISLEERFQGALTRAGQEVGQGAWASAEGALDEAESALDRWPGLIGPQEMFNLYFLRGMVRLKRGSGGQEDSFRQAAAMAWNREVVLPSQDEVVVSAWYEAQGKLISEGVGTLRIEASIPGVTCALDGIPLGEPPVDVRVFPGMHRLTAQQGGTDIRWQRGVMVHPKKTTSVKPAFDRAGEPLWVYQQLLQGLYRRRMDPVVGAMIAEWCQRNDVRLIRLVRAERVVGGSDPSAEVPTYDDLFISSGQPYDPRLETGDVAEKVYRLRQVFYDPSLRAFKDAR